MSDFPTLPQSGHEGLLDDTAQLDRLAYLDVLQPPYDKEDALAGMTVTVIGGGPAGLVFAKSAAAFGANVTVLEKAGDPRGADPGYTNRSFNITLDEVGRYVLADDRIWKNDGTWLIGRAVHNFESAGTVDYFDYPETAKIVSIPRPVLRQNMVNATLEQGATILFHTHVVKLNPASGRVAYLAEDGQEKTIEADLVVVADGLHSIGDKFRTERFGEGFGITTETRSYMAAVLKPEDYTRLDQHYIHVWQETASDSFTLGLPTKDGRIGLLMEASFGDLPRQDSHPFPTPEIARKRLEKEFPQLYAEVPGLHELLPHHRRSHFSCKLVLSYKLGDRAVLVGDAACVFPPWAGIGANSAMYGAASLIYQLVNAGSMDEALSIYETQQRFLAPHMIELAKGIGTLFNSAITKKPKLSNDSGLALMVRDARRQAGQLSGY